jgi:hypothetical protein
MLGIHDEYGNAQLLEIIHHKNKKNKTVFAFHIYIYIYVHICVTECSPVWTWIGPYFPMCVGIASWSIMMS